VSHEALVEIRGGKATGRTAADAEVLAELEGGTYRAVLTQPKGRSLSQLNLFWKVCEMLAENYPGDLHKDEVAHILKIETGHSRAMRLQDGTYVRLPRSIAFNAMSPEAFSAWLDRAFDAAAQKFGPALADAVRGELDSIIHPIARAA
jgi:hypothetical protein